MASLSCPDRIRVVFDDNRLVANAGLLPSTLTILLDTGRAAATTKTLRRRFFSLPGRITRKACRITLHLPQGRP